MMTLATINIIAGAKKIDTVSNTAYDDINKFDKLSTSINPAYGEGPRVGTKNIIIYEEIMPV